MNHTQKAPGVCQIFLSCVSKGFLPQQEMLTKDLSLPHVKVQVQEDFTQSGYSTLENLDDSIKGCAAVTHLIGSTTGSNASLPFHCETHHERKRHSTRSLDQNRSQLRPTLVYLHRLRKRLNEVGMPPTDAVYRNVNKAIEDLQSLGMSLHYRSRSGGVAGADRCPE
jgi:hypothetical protein